MITLLQINAAIGDWEGVYQAIYEASHNSSTDWIVTGELSLCGGFPADFLKHDNFIQGCQNLLNRLAQTISPNVRILVGCPDFSPIGHLRNSIFLIEQGHYVWIASKKKLDNLYRLDSPYFEVGLGSALVEYDGGLWRVSHESDLEEVSDTEAITGIIVLGQRPYFYKGSDQHREYLSAASKRLRVPLLYANLCGGQDRWIWAGYSSIWAPSGLCQASLDEQPGFLSFVRSENTSENTFPHIVSISWEEEMYRALVVSLQDYLKKNHITRIVLGLSGGIDSALVALIACDAIGAENCQAFFLPMPWTSLISHQGVNQLSTNLNLSLKTVHIHSLFQSLSQTIHSEIKDITAQNLQARIRGLLLMSWGNEANAIILNTSNKSEAAQGYCTLYGDSIGGFAILSDVYKTWVYRLVAWRDPKGLCIPNIIRERAPSAELKEGQLDQDDLPEYDFLDSILIEREINRNSYEEHPISLRWHHSAFKRDQAPLGPCITQATLSEKWDYPLTHYYLSQKRRT